MPTNTLLILLPFVVVAVLAVVVFVFLGRRSAANGASSNGINVRIFRGVLPWLVVTGVIAGIVAVSAITAGRPASQATYVLLILAAVLGLGGAFTLAWIWRRFDVHGRRR